jgi:hypothetical protein
MTERTETADAATSPKPVEAVAPSPPPLPCSSRPARAKSSPTLAGPLNAADWVLVVVLPVIAVMVALGSRRRTPLRSRRMMQYALISFFAWLLLWAMTAR